MHVFFICLKNLSLPNYFVLNYLVLKTFLQQSLFFDIVFQFTKLINKALCKSVKAFGTCCQCDNPNFEI